MTRDASLTEFGVDGDDDDEESAVAPAESPADDGGASAEDAGGDHDPVRPTSRWSAEPRPCVDCGTEIQRAWTDDGRLRCADCKEW